MTEVACAHSCTMSTYAEGLEQVRVFCDAAIEPRR